MKRSDMLKDILWWLNDQLYTIDDSGEGDIHPQCADDLLSMIEKAGMLPPPSSYFIEYNNKDQLKGINLLRNSCVWEPEKEEK